ncbi:MAG: GGDEF domain-containing protein [Lachnospiraceae bacterium]|nr:GGDEF domain-containing protein [Lachnospiraceae bacterium]
MKGKRINSNIRQTLTPVFILLVVFIVLLVRFTVSGKSKERTEAEEKLVSMMQGYAAQMQMLIYGVQKSADSAAVYMAADSSAEQEAVLAAIYADEAVYDAAICDVDGTGYRFGGERIDLSGTEYFESAFTGEGKVLYVADDGISGQTAILVVAPVLQDESAVSYVLCYVDIAEFEKLVKRTHLNSNTFYILLENSGQIVAAAGSTNSALCKKDGNYFVFLRENQDNKVIDRLYTRVQNKNSDVTYLSWQKDDRMLIYVPVGIGNLTLLSGVEKSYVDAMVKRNWSSSNAMVWQIVIVLFLFVGAVLTIYIISQKKSNEKGKELANKADTDLLTGLYNKMATERKIKEQIAEHPDELGLLFVLDIDNFKKINDTMGHAFGDEVLRTLGWRIKAEFRATDIVGRTGGDEFTIFLCNMKTEEIIRAEASRVERFFKDFKAGEATKYSATASIGAAIFPKDGKDFETLYKAADKALYVAKKRGKNQLAFYGDTN